MREGERERKIPNCNSSLVASVKPTESNTSIASSRTDHKINDKETLRELAIYKNSEQVQTNITRIK